MKFLIVGLGNIGPEYELTRHNIGFLVLDRLAEKQKAEFATARLADHAEFRLKGKAIHLIKPNTYMNLSGKAMAYWMTELNIPKEQALVVVDDHHHVLPGGAGECDEYVQLNEPRFSQITGASWHSTTLPDVFNPMT